ncbi:uncharacterized protein LOC121381253 isoform X2 [Gigantopelta aegis]|uniref:uncharacterized protein LOC121381253 isoform X2 n=1 Tax=Gigantopelta aegis TaxID=1735272 RepID=UPI001B88AE8E|nr:uncharacterized protein LOC121381253 isoform X2 [Gigantopelta aegis]
MMKRVSCILFLNACLSSWFLFDRNLATADSCTKTGPCTCRNSKGTIDLSALASTSGSPRFQDLAGIGQWLYSWNPCVAFTEGSCSNVAACQTTTGKKKYYNIGTQDSATFNTDSTGKVTLSYSATQEKFTSTQLHKASDNWSMFEILTNKQRGHLLYDFNALRCLTGLAGSRRLVCRSSRSNEQQKICTCMYKCFFAIMFKMREKIMYRRENATQRSNA